ncbi:MAG: UxaA family hydrolase [Synergistaceae bacterium]|nr:UxaA family hydrolase [Synergistaceae bacterium]
MPAFDAHCVTEKDNVAVVIHDVAAGDTVMVQRESETLRLLAATAVPAGHKIALRGFEKNDPVLKYGEVIGNASERIPTGTHVHVHNLEGLRGRGDKR